MSHSQVLGFENASRDPLSSLSTGTRLLTKHLWPSPKTSDPLHPSDRRPPSSNSSDLFPLSLDPPTQDSLVQSTTPRSISVGRGSRPGSPPCERQFAYPLDLTERRVNGWPELHPCLHHKDYDGLHPFKIPDHIFTQALRYLEGQERLWLEEKDPYKNGTFDASCTPWWTHWLIAFAHTQTKMQESDICKIYKRRYEGVIPGIERMTEMDECELWTTIQDGHHRYAFRWDRSDESELFDFLEKARKRL